MPTIKELKTKSQSDEIDKYPNKTSLVVLILMYTILNILRQNRVA